MKNLQLENKDSIQVKATNAIRKSILSGDFQPGEKLVQEQLAEYLGISRMPIRESLKQLEIEGFVTIEPYRGAFVNDVDVSAIEETYALRSNLEKMALQRAAPHLTQGDLEELEDYIKLMDEENNPNDFVQLNVTFHKLLLKHCDWGRLNKFIELLWNGYAQQTPEFLLGQIDQSNIDHKVILEHLKKGNFSEASLALQEHISKTGARLVDYIQRINS
ncbi:transcriptional regulator, GntR family [Geomicrobium sp. JCM 19037]|uniref:GntR family transcriptional regulator n=1 Tax=Geomicrobium sp. JCM 19037 TaxID=1460634 RepID=UPI00045F4CE6|nr:GntR family transcriptional regulator [Geomicrobium sp. JCM 19037]GAK04905.1 transcriptional regulator, GntR family [Geomicrobium sp. JCM 19037]